MSESEIRAAVKAARPKLPRLAANYADQAIAAGKTVEQVKVDLVERMLGIHTPDASEAARADTVARMAADLSASARAPAAGSVGRPQGVDPKAAIIGNAGAPAAAPMPTMMQRSMLAVIERTQGKASRAQAEARLAARVR